MFKEMQQNLYLKIKPRPMARVHIRFKLCVRKIRTRNSPVGNRFYFSVLIRFMASSTFS